MGFFSGSIVEEGYQFKQLRDIEGYDQGYYSAQQAMLDQVQNEQQLFEGMILCDIQESVMRINGANDYEIMAFTENVLTDVLGKIKEFLMKVWEKIKAIFKGWMARIDSVMMSSNKDFVNKYKDTVLKKDLTDMEVKWRKPKKGLDAIPAFQVDNAKLDTKTHFANGQVELDKWDEEANLETILKGIDKSFTDRDSFEKDFIDYMFDDEDTDDKIDIHDIMSQLISFRDIKRGWKKANDSLTKAMNNLTKTIDKDQTELAKAMPVDSTGKIASSIKLKKYEVNNSPTDGHASWETKSDEESEYDVDGSGTARKTLNISDKNLSVGGTADESKTIVEKYRKALSLVQKWANLYSIAANKYTAAVMKVLKLHNDQNRKIWAKAVAYSRKEEAVMTEAMVEIAADYGVF